MNNTINMAQTSAHKFLASIDYEPLGLLIVLYYIKLATDKMVNRSNAREWRSFTDVIKGLADLDLVRVTSMKRETVKIHSMGSNVPTIRGGPADCVVVITELGSRVVEVTELSRRVDACVSSHSASALAALVGTLPAEELPALLSSGHELVRELAGERLDDCLSLMSVGQLPAFLVDTDPVLRSVGSSLLKQKVEDG